MAGVSDLIPDETTFLGQVIAFAARRATGWGLGDRNFVGKIARMLVMTFGGWFRTVRQADADAVPTPDSSHEGLVRAASVYGLDSGTPGVYGPKGPIPAVGAVGQATGTAGSAVPAGTQLSLNTNGQTVLYEVRDLVTLPGLAPSNSQALLTLDAITPGSIGNLSIGAVLSFVSAPAGMDASVTITAGTNNTGRDGEDDGSLYSRIALRLQLPPKGGAPQDYGHGGSAWPENATDATGTLIPGLRVYGYSGGFGGNGEVSGGYDGLAAVMGVVTQAGSGAARIPPAQTLTAVNLYVRGSTSQAGLSPICASVRYIAPYQQVGVTDLIVRVPVVPSRGGDSDFNWHRGGSTFTVNAVTGTVDAGGWSTATGAPPAGVNQQIELSALAPNELKTVIAAGSRPLFYVDNRTAGAPRGLPVPAQAQALAWKDVGGRTRLCYATPAGWLLPAVGEGVYPGHGKLVPLLGAAVVAYVDGLGPSRLSGLADPFDVWDDTCSISGIETACKNTTDSDGITPLIARTKAGATTIQVGAGGTPAVQDVQPPDNTTYGPGMWTCARVLIQDT